MDVSFIKIMAAIGGHESLPTIEIIDFKSKSRFMMTGKSVHKKENLCSHQSNKTISGLNKDINHIFGHV